jgi:peptidoglycan hydrolase-like protein with peptidoglycan-binding domain
VRSKLGEAPVEAAPLKPSPPLLRIGTGGWQVTRLQRLLRTQGCFPEPAAIDGDFGEITEAAVKAFQELNGLQPDGIVGPVTWAALETAPQPVSVSPRLQPV